MPGGLNVTVVGQSLIKRDIGAHPDPRFRAVVAKLQQADLAFTNLEATIRGAYGGWPTKPGYFGAADPFVLDVLRDIGISALSVANNHAFDLGPGGVLSTIEEVGRRGFLAAGLGMDATDAARAGIRDMPVGRMALVAMDAGPMAEQSTAKDATDRVPSRPGVNPLRVTPVFTIPDAAFTTLSEIEASLGHRAQAGAYRHARKTDAPEELDFYGQRFRRGLTASKTGLPDPADRARNLAAITAAKARARFVIAYVHHHHWEAVWEDVPDWMRGFARDCIDAGADLFASHGVPLVQGIEIYRGRPLFFSLGNFIFHSFNPANWHHDDIWRSVIATCRFAPSGELQAITLDPIVLGGEAALRQRDFSNRDVPLLAEADGTPLLHKIADLSTPFGTSMTISNNQAEIWL